MHTTLGNEGKPPCFHCKTLPYLEIFAYTRGENEMRNSRREYPENF